MPELAEVETVREVLINWCKGKTIKSIECFYPLILENCTIDDLEKTLIGKKIDDIRRHGKHLIFDIGEYCLLSHLRMEGKYFLFNDDAYKSKHNHLAIHLDNNTVLCYNDTRKFGRFNLIKKTDLYTNSIISELGKEPFDTSYMELYEKAKNYSGTIKEFLLDQHIMAGLGNIYADEVCFASRLVPFVKAKTLSIDDCQNIVNSSIDVLNKAIKAGGSSVHSFSSGNGVDGRFQNELNVYGRENQKCKVCGNILTKTLIATRSTIYCPNCQVIHAKTPRIIGITGLIASGKSTILAILKKYDYKILDCDMIANQAYLDDEIIKKLISVFKTSDKLIIRDIVIRDANKLKELESIIHPYVINKIKNQIKDGNKYSIEASQLFESKLHKICDYTIMVVCDERIRQKRLRDRNPNDYYKYKNLNNNLTDGYKKVKLANYAINTTYGKDSIEEQIKNMFNNFL